MVAVIACAGKSTRLFPCTNFLSKQLLPLYDKPLIYYPISMLVNAGIKDIAIIVNDENFELYKKQLKDFDKMGLNIQIILDPKPQGTVGALKMAADFIKGQKVCFVLGDNFFYGKEFDEEFKKAVSLESGAYCFGYPVKNPSAYGVASFDKKGNVTKLVEKPKNPESNMCVTGLYCYDENCLEYANKCQLSARNEYEVTDLNMMYLQEGNLKLAKMSKKNYWLDAGTSEGLYRASEFVYKTIKKTNQQIGCVEEACYKQNLITKERLAELYEGLKKTDYGKYLEKYL